MKGSMIVGLKLKGGTEHNEVGGSVDIVGSCVVLRDSDKQVVIAYCLLPGEVLRKGSSGGYAIEY